MAKTSYMPPETSVAAYREVKAKGKSFCHREIVHNTLLKLRNKMGTASDIAMHCTLDYYEVNRRVKELIMEERIYIFSERGGRSMGDNPCRIYKVCEAGVQGQAAGLQGQVAGAEGRCVERDFQGQLF